MKLNRHPEKQKDDDSDKDIGLLGKEITAKDIIDQAPEDSTY